MLYELTKPSYSTIQGELTLAALAGNNTREAEEPYLRRPLPCCFHHLQTLPPGAVTSAAFLYSVAHRDSDIHRRFALEGGADPQFLQYMIRQYRVGQSVPLQPDEPMFHHLAWMLSGPYTAGNHYRNPVNAYRLLSLSDNVQLIPSHSVLSIIRYRGLLYATTIWARIVARLTWLSHIEPVDEPDEVLANFKFNRPRRDQICLYATNERQPFGDNLDVMFGLFDIQDNMPIIKTDSDPFDNISTADLMLEAQLMSETRQDRHGRPEFTIAHHILDVAFPPESMNMFQYPYGAWLILGPSDGGRLYGFSWAGTDFRCSVCMCRRPAYRHE